MASKKLRAETEQQNFNLNRNKSLKRNKSSCFKQFCFADTDETVFVVYDVECCPGNRDDQASPSYFIDDGKVNTLIVLGVGTLLSILLMCGFVFAGLIMIHRR